MYAFRKPFGAADYQDATPYMGLAFKSALIIAQVLGYATSKFIGIKVVSELGKNGRATAILTLMGIAHLALLGFALSPTSIKPIFLFINGLPLGMIWGLIFSYLEGRRFTEVMGVGMCASFALSSGLGKSVGKWLMLQGTSPYWMPFMTGALFLPFMLLFVYMLAQIPGPTAQDIALRTERQPMNARQRLKFFNTFWPGLILLIVMYMLLTAFRDFRDNFMAEMLMALGYGGQAGLFTATEIPVTLGVLLLLGLIMFISSNIKALLVNHAVLALGFTTIGLSTLLFRLSVLPPIGWIVLTGMGAYMAYIPFNCILFERLIASFRYVSNAGFLIYLADSFGYLGSVAVLVYKDFGQEDLAWIDFFAQGGAVVSMLGFALSGISALYFYHKHRRWSSTGGQ
jgi:hypothetical protein